MKEHLPCTHKNVAACRTVPKGVKKIKKYMKEFENAKHTTLTIF